MPLYRHGSGEQVLAPAQSRQGRAYAQDPAWSEVEPIADLQVGSLTAGTVQVQLEVPAVPDTEPEHDDQLADGQDDDLAEDEES